MTRTFKNDLDYRFIVNEGYEIFEKDAIVSRICLVKSLWQARILVECHNRIKEIEA